MPIQTVTIDTLLDELRRDLRAQSVTFLVGAGVSMLGPSSLPSGNALKDMAVAGLCSTPELRRLLRKLRHRKRYWTITPEIVFQRLYASLGHGSLLPFFQVLRHADRNDAHCCLARLTRAFGCRILTTNFDVLLENAGVPREKVEHLHGVVDHPRTLIARINQVGRGIPSAVSKAMQRWLADRTLCVLGYSGNDEDIRRVVVGSRARRILWLTARKDDWAWTNMPIFGRSHALLAAEGDLRTLFQALMGGTADWTPVDRQTIAARSRFVADWASEPRIADRYACLSEIFFEIEDYTSVLEVSTEALRYARGTELSGWFRIQMADALKILGRFDEAEHHGRAAVRINRRLGDPYEIAGAYNQLGVLLVEKEIPEADRGLVQLRHALAILDNVDLRRCTHRRREGIMILKGRVLNNLGLALEWLGDYRSALATYRDALSIKARTGDVLGEAKTAGNVSIAAGAIGDPRASTALERALYLMDRYELRRDKAYVLRRHGELACRNGRTGEGLSLLRRALELYSQIDGSHFAIRLTKRALRNCGTRGKARTTKVASASGRRRSVRNDHAAV